MKNIKTFEGFLNESGVNEAKLQGNEWKLWVDVEDMINQLKNKYKGKVEKGKIKEFILDYASDLNESTVMEDLEITTNEFVSSLNEGKVLTPAEAKEVKDGISKAIEGIKETPSVDDKTKVNLVKTGIGLAVINALAEKFGDREATPEARSKMKDFMSKINFAKSLDDVEKVIFDVVDYALEVAQETK